MGNNSSIEEQEHVGYRVLGVQPHSPASRGGLVSFFDFIIAANGVPLKSLDTTFVELIKASEEKPLPLTVYNCKNRSVREIILVPSKNWPGEGMLGVTIRFDTYHDAEENMCHVLEIETNSPAELAGLQSMNDYLLGTAEKAFKDTDILFSELKESVDKPIEIYVYNTETDAVRVVVIMPSSDWGGEGILGANVAHGYLHVLPASCCNTIGMSQLDTSSHSVVNSPFGMNLQTTSFQPYPMNTTQPVTTTTHPESMPVVEMKGGSSELSSNPLLPVPPPSAATATMTTTTPHMEAPHPTNRGGSMVNPPAIGVSFYNPTEVQSGMNNTHANVPPPNQYISYGNAEMSKSNMPPNKFPEADLHNTMPGGYHANYINSMPTTAQNNFMPKNNFYHQQQLEPHYQQPVNESLKENSQGIDIQLTRR